MPLSRRRFLLGSLALPALAAKKPAGERPNILLILADDLPSWVLGVNGNKEFRTPNLDRLAQTGTSFRNHAVASPDPVPSRTTVLTGRTPMQLGPSGAAGSATLDKVLAGAGYQARATTVGAPAADVTTEAGKLLDQQTVGKPSFLLVSYGGLVPPYEGVAEKYRDLYAQVKFDTVGYESPAPGARRGKEMMADQVGNLRRFAAALTALDDQVGALIAGLRQRRLVDGTLVIFTSTCGSLLGRHGLWDAGEASDPVNMYEEAVATPLFWSWPGHVPAQAVRPEQVSAYDLVASICDLTAAALPAGSLCGRSYLPLATGKALPKKHPWRTTVFGRMQGTDMARQVRYKLVQRDQGKGTGELYDLSVDPREKVNQFENPQFVTVRTALASELARWKQQFSA